MNKELIEKAAEEYANKTYPKTPLVGDWLDDGYDEGWNDAKNSKCQPDFIAGAEWMSQQSKWIDINDRSVVMPNNQLCLLRLEDGSIVRDTEDWEDRRLLITHWMPIPPFNKNDYE